MKDDVRRQALQENTQATATVEPVSGVKNKIRKITQAPQSQNQTQTPRPEEPRAISTSESPSPAPNTSPAPSNINNNNNNNNNNVPTLAPGAVAVPGIASANSPGAGQRASLRRVAPDEEAPAATSGAAAAVPFQSLGVAVPVPVKGSDSSKPGWWIQHKRLVLLFAFLLFVAAIIVTTVLLTRDSGGDNNRDNDLASRENGVTGENNGNADNENTGGGLDTFNETEAGREGEDNNVSVEEVLDWQQLGPVIFGEAFEEQSGYSVSLSAEGDVVAIGAPFSSVEGIGLEVGRVRVYAFDGALWTQRGDDMLGEAVGDLFGWSVSISADGTVVAVGAQRNDAAGDKLNAGHARAYELRGTSWVQRGTDFTGDVAGDRMGWSVVLSADGLVLAIGTPYDDRNCDTGYTRVFAYDGTDWVQRGSDIVGKVGGDRSGWSVSLSSSGSTIAIGASHNEDTGDENGKVRIYRFEGDEWVQLGFGIDGEDRRDYSGWSVSLSGEGDMVAIGAPFNDGSKGEDSGHVRVYGYVDNEWVPIGSDIDGGAAFDESGRSVSLSANGTTIAVASPLSDGNGDNSGRVRVYDYDGSDWNKRGIDIDGIAAGSNSGWSVSLSSDGNRVAVGARFLDDCENGHVRVFGYSPVVDGAGGMNSYTGGCPDNVARWQQVGSDIVGEKSNQRSTCSVSLSSDASVVAIGMPRNLGDEADSGHVRVYAFDGGVWSQRGSDIEDGTFADDFFGWFVSVSLSSSGDVVAVGSPQNADNGRRSGSVRVLTFNGTDWVQRGSQILGEAEEDFSGFAVSLSSDGTIVAVTSPYAYANGDEGGHVRIFKFEGDDWIQLGSTISGRKEYEEIGRSVSLSSDGTIITVGSPHCDGGGGEDYNGCVRIYEFVVSDWVQRGSDINGENNYERSGAAVSMSADGDIVAVGAPGNSEYETGSGATRVYKFDGTNWSQLGGDIAGKGEDDASGSSVSLSDDGLSIVIGSPRSSVKGDESGRVLIYDFDGAEWVQRGHDIDGQAAFAEAGWSVSMSADGSTIATAAPFGGFAFGEEKNTVTLSIYTLDEQE